MSSLQQYLDLYAAQGETLCGASCGAMNAAREAALAGLQQHGLPTSRNERYKYTDVEAALAPDYGLNLRRTLPAVDPYKEYRCAVPHLSTSLYFVVNDVPYTVQTPTAPLPEGVLVQPLSQADPALVAAYYNREAGRKYDGVTALNTLLAQDGLLVYLPAGTILSNPIQIVNVAAARADLMVNRRLLIVAEKGAQGVILLCEHTDGQCRTLATQVTEIFVCEGANIQVNAVEETTEQHTALDNVYVHQAAASHVSYNGVILTCGQTRHRLDFRLDGKGADMVARGVVVADGQQRVDNSLVVDHVAPGCTSDMLYKYVLDGQSVGAFAGLVLVEKGAQKSLSQQTNANICAAPTARAFSQPMLEIYADDVKCNHGSTIGKLDESALFYMRQRGIPEREARLILQQAFVGDVLRHIELERLRDRLAHLVEMRFRGELSACAGCKMCR